MDDQIAVSRVGRTVDVRSRSIGDLSWPLRRAVKLRAAELAVVDRDRRVTYAELGVRANGLGAGLARRGLRRGDVVAMLAGNSLEYIEAWLGIPSAGFVLNPLNFRLAEAELTFILADSGARAIVTDARFAETAMRLAHESALIEHVIWADPADAPPGVIPWSVLVETELTASAAASEAVHLVHEPDTLAAIVYTGGTTGLPKGVMQSHGNLWSNAMNTLVGLPLSFTDRYLHASPMFHSAGAANIFSLTLQGGVHVVLPAFEPGEFLRLAAAERTTATVIVPTMLNALLNHPDIDRADLSAWRTMGLGAAPPPVELLARGSEMLPCDIRQLYGATETGPHVSSTRAGDIRRWLADGDHQRLRSCGIADIGIELEVRRPGGLRCEAGEIGEFFVRGPNVTLGYWNRPQETSAALGHDGWYRTGDLGYEADDGYLYVVDRAKDMIISGGENVYTSEVENAIHHHPAVLEAAVFGIPHQIWGEAVHAEVVVRPGHTLDVGELIGLCRTMIAGFKVPRSVQLRTEPLPKSGANKILKRDLRAPYWENAGHG